MAGNILILQLLKAITLKRKLQLYNILPLLLYQELLPDLYQY